MPPRPSLSDRLIRLQPELLRLAYRLTGDPFDAQDLCQDVLLKLWIRGRAAGEVGDLRAYAMRTLRNAHLQCLRRPPPGALTDAAMPGTVPDALTHLALGEVRRAIDRLPANQARLIRLVALGETSPAALARLTGWPEGTVMSRLARARARLRAEMGLAARAPVAALI